MFHLKMSFGDERGRMFWYLYKLRLAGGGKVVIDMGRFSVWSYWTLNPVMKQE